jgi:DNA-binding IclR family transcriptional regulator
MTNSERNPVSKTLKALIWLIQQPNDQIGVREMATALNIAPSTAHRVFSALSESGFVQQDPASSRYVLGLELFRLSQLIAARIPIGQIARSHMRKLFATCNETVLLGLYDDVRQEMIFADSIESTNSLRYVIALNTWMPVYAGASGLAIMAFLPKETIESIIARSRLEPVTANTITEPYRLEHELEAIRERGYAISKGQRIQGAVGLAAPIMKANGVLGDICVTIPESRYDLANQARLAELLMACARDITAEIGGRITPR